MLEMLFLCKVSVNTYYNMLTSHNLDIEASLTLKWPRYFYYRWCPRGGSMELPEKTTFPLEFCNEIYTIYVRAIKNHHSAKKKKKIKMLYRFKMAAK